MHTKAKGPWKKMPSFRRPPYLSLPPATAICISAHRNSLGNPLFSPLSCVFFYVEKSRKTQLSDTRDTTPNAVDTSSGLRKRVNPGRCWPAADEQRFGRGSSFHGAGCLLVRNEHKA